EALRPAGAREGLREGCGRLQPRWPESEALGAVHLAPAEAGPGSPGGLQQGLRARFHVRLPGAIAPAEDRPVTALPAALYCIQIQYECRPRPNPAAPCGVAGGRRAVGRFVLSLR